MRVRVVCDEIRAREHPDGKPVQLGFGSGVGRPAFEADVSWLDPPHIGDGEIHIPADAKHSLEDGENEIQWKVVIRGKAYGWFPVFWEYPFVVQPAVTV